MCQPGRPGPHGDCQLGSPGGHLPQHEVHRVAFHVVDLYARAGLQLIQIRRDSSPYCGSLSMENITSPLLAT